MNLDQTMQIDSATPLMTTLSTGRDCESLLGDNSIGDLFELRVLQHACQETIDRVNQQLSLIELIEYPAIRAITQRLSDSAPYSFGLSLPLGVSPVDDRLDYVLHTLDARERMDIASQLIDAIAEAHRIGLYHGSMAAATVLVGRSASSTSVYIDFSATSFDESIEIGSLSVEQDLFALRSLLRTLLSPLTAPENSLCALEPISGRERAMLLQWLSADDSLPPTIGQWQTVFRPTNKNEATPVDQTGVVDIQKQEAGSDSTYNLEVLPNTLTTTAPGPIQLGRFRIADKIGEGAMGAVYRATDTSNGEIVALKVLSSNGKDIAQSIRRFRKEARLLADVGNDHVTRLIDVGEDGGTHYLAMEYVNGVDLKQWLGDRGPLPEADALRIAADLARALVEAHSRGVIHRDIKPENVLLQLRNDVDIGAIPTSKRPLNDFTVKLSDFGIARHVTQSESMELTRAGVIIGTPKYMSPEQCKSATDIGPAADVYSLGVTLYQLLVGKVPFESDDYMKLAAMHCFDTPPPLQKRVAEVSDMTTRIVERSLAKKPADRYGDASQMLAELTRTIRGEAADIEAHPKMPEHDAGKLWEKTVCWVLDSNPVDLWPLVSNTERLNEAIGLPAVNYRTEQDPLHGLRKFGSFKLSGVTVSWEEHPFEWIEGQRMGVLREFDAGPFKWFMSIVTLDARSGGGTLLSHHIRIEPRNLIGRALTTIEADWKGFRNLSRVYRRMDHCIQAKLGERKDEAIDPFTEVKRPTRANQCRINQRIENVIRRGADAHAANGLSTILCQWAAQDLSQLRPLHIADELKVSADDMIETCLIAATEGLLNLRWDVLCPACRVSAATTDLLSDIDSHTHCEACNVDFKSNLGDAIEMVFQAHPEVREVNNGQYCIGGPEHSPHVVAQVRLDPGESLDLDIDLAPGSYLLRGTRLPRAGRIRVEDRAAPSEVEFTLSELGGVHTSKLRVGRQRITVYNDLDVLHIVRIERTIPRDDIITATMAATNSTFRRLFREQTLANDTPIETETLSFLATVISNVDHLYNSLGDSSAYSSIVEHHQLLADSVTTSGGTIVKTIGERILAAFPRREQAVDAAMRIRQMIEEEYSGPIELGIGVHCGPTLVATQNNQLDYFGGTVRAVLKLPEFADADTLITEAVYSDSEIRKQYVSTNDKVETHSLPGKPNTRCKRVHAQQGKTK